MSPVHAYAMAGLPVSVRMPDDRVLAAHLARLLPEINPNPERGESVLVERQGDSVFLVTGEGLTRSFTCHDPVDTACGVTAGLIGAYAIAVQDKLCFHAAALICKGKAYLIPATYKSGKSTFCAAWMAAGHSIVTDDAAIFDVRTKHVSSFGIPLRLRNSLLRDGPQPLREFVATNLLLQGPRLSYVRSPDQASCVPGTSYPLGGWVFLDRKVGALPKLSRLRPTESLGQIIWQNFARQMPASDLLDVLRTAATQFPCFRLQYEECLDAVPLLASALERPDEHVPPAQQSEDLGTAFAVENDGSIEVTETPGGLYLADDRYGRIYFFNPSAGVMWKLAAAGLEIDEAIEVLAEVYRGEAARTLAQDYRRFLAEIASLGLLNGLQRPA